MPGAFVNALTALVGVTVIVLVLSDVFQSVIVPRAAARTYRLSFYLLRTLWFTWPRVAWRIAGRDENRREDLLAVYAPGALVIMLAVWVAVLMLAYGAIFWALRTQIAPALHSYWAAVYFAGASFLTIGYGDIVARTGVARLIALCAGASGLGVVSITTAFLFAIFGAFQTRERFVVTIGARAGSPPSGVGLLTTLAYANLRDDLAGVLRDGQQWMALVMESHLAYPMLAYFRSSHDYESWIGTLGTLLDACALLQTTVKDGTGQARIAYTLGRHATRDLSRNFLLNTANPTPGILRDEFDSACERLAAAGYALYDRDEAWTRFAAMRATYAADLNAMARYFEIPPLQWIGDRSLIQATRHSG